MRRAHLDANLDQETLKLEIIDRILVVLLVGSETLIQIIGRLLEDDHPLCSQIQAVRCRQRTICVLSLSLSLSLLSVPLSIRHGMHKVRAN